MAVSLLKRRGLWFISRWNKVLTAVPLGSRMVHSWPTPEVRAERERHGF